MVKISPRRRRWRFSDDPWQRVRVGVGLLATITLVGVIGYWLLGLSLFDALYQTIITVTTVGFEEFGEPDDIDTVSPWHEWRTYGSHTSASIPVGSASIHSLCQVRTSTLS